MADLVAVMHDGRLQQLAAPAELYAHPANLFVARFCGSPPMNVLSGDVDRRRLPRTRPGGVPLGRADHRGPVKLGFRPEHATMVEPGTAGALAAEVYVVEPLGNETLLALRVGDDLINLRAAAGVNPAVGQRVRCAAGHGHTPPVRRRHRRCAPSPTSRPATEGARA